MSHVGYENDLSMNLTLTILWGEICVQITLYLLISSTAPQFEIQGMLKQQYHSFCKKWGTMSSEKKKTRQEGHTALILSLSPRKSKKGFKEHKTELISRVNSNSKVLYAWECYQKTSMCADLDPFS